MKILQADESHLEMAVPLFEAYRQFFTQTPDLAGSTRFLQDRLRARDSVLFIAAGSAGAVGFLQLYPLFSSWFANRIWFLSDLYVDAASRGQSIGHMLVDAAIEHVRRTSASSIMVELPHSEPHLRRFYARFGFTKDDTFDLYRLRF